MPVDIWTEEGEVRTEVPVEKIREAEMWREATIASPTPLGLAALAVATFMFGVGAAFQTALLMWIPVLFIFGITLWTMSLFALRKGSTFVSTLFGIVGSLYVAYSAYIFYGPTFIAAGQATAPVIAVLLFVVGFILAYLWFCSIQHSAAMMLTILALGISYVLVGIGLLGHPAALVVGGWFGIASAFLAAYTSFAMVWNSVARREQVPMGARIREEVRAHA